MSAEPAFEAVMDRLRHGDQQAAGDVFRRYAGRLVGLARRRLDERARRLIDPEDVTQSVFRTFFRRCADHQFDLVSWDGLWSLLTVITLRKCGRQTRQLRAGCRDVRREEAPPAGPDGSLGGWEAPGREPTPAEAATLADTVEQLLRDLDEREQGVVTLSLAGHSIPDISRQLGRSERTVYRVLDRVRRQLRELYDVPG